MCIPMLVCAVGMCQDLRDVFASCASVSKHMHHMLGLKLHGPPPGQRKKEQAIEARFADQSRTPPQDHNQFIHTLKNHCSLRLPLGNNDGPYVGWLLAAAPWSLLDSVHGCSVFAVAWCEELGGGWAGRTSREFIQPPQQGSVSILSMLHKPICNPW